MNNKVDPAFGDGPGRGPKWALRYVESEQPMREEWREAFYDELVSSDLEYRKALEDSVRYYGVRWANETF
jgi:hypothetical protein